jgi:hypothetical protein
VRNHVVLEDWAVIFVLKGRVIIVRRSMILLIAFLLATLLSLASSAFCVGEQIKMKVTDASDSGSPITVSGEVVFTDTQAGPTPYSFQATASATNVSGRDMLLVVVSFEVTGTHKFDLLETDQQDYFFSPHPLRPGAAQEFDSFSARYGPLAGRTEPEHTEPPQATARLEFVQFADGSTWGDPDSANQTLEFRKETLTELNVLQKVYRSGGEQAFTEELSKPSFFPAINALKHVCSEKNDPGCLVDAMIRVVQDAKQHAGGLRSGKGSS